MSDHLPLHLEHFLPYRLSILSNRVSQAIARDYERQFSLSMTEWRVMAVLARFDELSAGEVAARTAMDKVAVSRAVSRLVAAGRATRETHDGDKRRSVLRLSEAGLGIYDQIAAKALAFEQHLLADMNDSERKLLFELLDRLDELELRAENVEIPVV